MEVTFSYAGTKVLQATDFLSIVNYDWKDMDMSEDELNENDDDGIPLTPPTPGTFIQTVE